MHSELHALVYIPFTSPAEYSCVGSCGWSFINNALTQAPELGVYGNDRVSFQFPCCFSIAACILDGAEPPVKTQISNKSFNLFVVGFSAIDKY